MQSSSETVTAIGTPTGSTSTNSLNATNSPASKVELAEDKELSSNGNLLANSTETDQQLKTALTAFNENLKQTIDQLSTFKQAIEIYHYEQSRRAPWFRANKLRLETVEYYMGRRDPKKKAEANFSQSTQAVKEKDSQIEAVLSKPASEAGVIENLINELTQLQQKTNAPNIDIFNEDLNTQLQTMQSNYRTFLFNLLDKKNKIPVKGRWRKSVLHSILEDNYGQLNPNHASLLLSSSETFLSTYNIERQTRATKAIKQELEDYKLTIEKNKKTEMDKLAESIRASTAAELKSLKDNLQQAEQTKQDWQEKTEGLEATLTKLQIELLETRADCEKFARLLQDYRTPLPFDNAEDLLIWLIDGLKKIDKKLADDITQTGLTIKQIIASDLKDDPNLFTLLKEGLEKETELAYKPYKTLVGELLQKAQNYMKTLTEALETEAKKFSMQDNSAFQNAQTTVNNNHSPLIGKQSRSSLSLSNTSPRFDVASIKFQRLNLSKITVYELIELVILKIKALKEQLEQTFKEHQTAAIRQHKIAQRLKPSDNVTFASMMKEAARDALDKQQKSQEDLFREIIGYFQAPLQQSADNSTMDSQSVTTTQISGSQTISPMNSSLAVQSTLFAHQTSGNSSIPQTSSSTTSNTPKPGVGLYQLYASGQKK